MSLTSEIQMVALRADIAAQLAQIYPQLGADDTAVLAERVVSAAGVPDELRPPRANPALTGPGEAMLITYGDTLSSDDASPLQALGVFWRDHLADVFSTMHVLPFFPSSSDGGFSVVDYYRVAPALGNWNDLADAVNGHELMVDLVCNHGSARSEWFADFIADRPPGRDYYLTADPDDDLGMVTRPRTHALLKEVETAAGPKHVWATFSHDQVDFDFANPDVLVEFCRVLGFYLEQGASRVRLDAIAYLWKQIGTTCIHLPETHRVIKLMRTLVQAYDPDVLLITETNVPHADNVSYFGDGDEAHVVYNFTFAPLLAWSAITGRADVLTNWLRSLVPPPPDCTFLNFIASHDGIGLRPVEDLITDTELAPIIDAATAVGGDVSAYSTPAGPRPYELNVSLADLLAGPNGDTADRFVVAHAAMLAAQGVPAIYVHSLLCTPGDRAAVATTGHKRDINRVQLTVDEATNRIATGWRAQVFTDLRRLLQVRRSHGAFAPAAPQRVLELHQSVVAIERSDGSDRVLALHNMSGLSCEVALPPEVGVRDLITDETVALGPNRTVQLGPWQALWLTT